ncbi:MAG: NTP transferase domain-containing protein [Desulfobacteraceae bacterium]|nr:NTP transferase domain-containing protein [Desulfobacteraceae bacterium]
MKNITVSSNITIKEAMGRLDETAEKALLVVDDDKKLIGALTDGDIRRHILKDQNLIDTIENAYNREPFFVFQDEFDLEAIKELFTENMISLIPILDRDRRVVDYITWEKVFGDGKKEIKQKVSAPVVIMAGGKGTRLKPFTTILPKPLIPVGNKPVMDHIIDRFRAHGITSFYFTVNHMSKIIRAYFEEKNPDYTIDFVQEDEPRGTAGSLELIKNELNTPFFVSNCDIIIEADYSDLYQFHTNDNYDITLVAAAKQFDIPYGVCELNGGGSLKGVKEKPGYNFLVNTGLYVLNPNVLELIPGKGMFHMTHLIDAVKANGGKVGVYPVSEKSWIDVGQWEEYRRSVKQLRVFND